ncbi:hypothetical protein F503_01008 [Ophiostoma piceae UAMH 11346]|uniref:2EXR domain-containing protein n=1 Tax=Ophiostoma piceae (strain UAMH 11346) TaxID=1262450 RepID=S3D4C8_OPHP1|nr:hypothetical protein F503_01008 [Ophiostoma piceae UAMH 11346]
MAHPAATIAPAQMDTISFRRADGSRYEVAYDGYANITPRRPDFASTATSTSTSTTTTIAASTTHTAASTVPRYTFSYNPGSRYVSDPLGYDAGFGSGYGSRFGSSYNGGYNYPFTQKHRQELPRNVMRPYRQDNDEPAEPILFVRETRRSICSDGQARSRCSKCKQAITTHPNTGGERETNTCKGFMTSPQRVFRDIIMTDAGEPLRPAVRDALLGAFSQENRETEEESTFHCFSLLPFEIRRMIWEAALPSRVLLREDLCHTTYRGIRKTFRPGNHVHTIEELWQSDLFYVCVESRRVVTALVRGAGPSTEAVRPATPMQPLMMSVTTRTKLRTGLDVLYYPWLGSKKAQDRGGGGPIRHGPPYMALPDASPPPHAYAHNHPTSRGSFQAPASAASVCSSSLQPAVSHRGYTGMGVYCMPGLYQAQRQSQFQGRGQGQGQDAESEEGPESCRACHPPTKSATTGSTSRAKQTSSSIAPYPINSIPYGHWASQLRILRVPATTVALDIAWIDKQHPDTLAWAVGVDLSEPLDRDRNERYAQPKPVPPECLQVVLADITIPVHISLDNCSSPEQRQLLQRHIYAHPTTATMASYRVAKKGESDAGSEQDSLVNLNGKDYTILVNLYDDRRMEELVSLARDPDGGHEILNKSALHRCIGCTRRAWEARSSTSPTAWSSQFGDLVGGHLQKICRPTILFTIVLVFDKVGA